MIIQPACEPKPLEEKTREELIEHVRRLTDKLDLQRASNAAERDAALKRMGGLRKAKRLANRRADMAEEGMRALLDAFQSDFAP